MADDITFELGMSPSSTVFYGYGGKHVTLDQLATKWSWSAGAREFKRRNLAMYFNHPNTTQSGTDAEGRPILHSPMGCGSAGRDPVQQKAEFLRRHSTSPTGRSSRNFEGRKYYLKEGMAPYAPPGSSVHEAGVYEGACLATDNVGWEDGWHIANANRFGLKTFENVNGEPWHAQPVEFSNGRSALDREVAEGRKLGVWDLPPFGPVVGRDNMSRTTTSSGEPAEEATSSDGSAQSPTSQPDSEATAPSAEGSPGSPEPETEKLPDSPDLPVTDLENGLFGLWPLGPKVLLTSDVAHTGRNEELLKYAQAVLKQLGLYTIEIDGRFGPATEDAVKAFQTSRGLDPDGRIGTGETWPALDLAASELSAA